VVFADQPRQPCSIAIREVDVQQNSVNIIVTQFCQRHLNGVGNGGKMASFFKGHAQNISDNGVILNNQNVHIQTFLTLLLVVLAAASHDFTAKTK
jgi:hypothetical protein